MNTTTCWPRSILAIASILAILNASPLRADEAFPATHVLAYFASSAGSTRVRGAGIARLDRVARSLRYRISFGTVPQSLAGLWLLRHHGHHQSETDIGYDTLRAISFSRTGVTFSGEIADLDNASIASIDSGVAELHFDMADHPGETLGAVIDAVASATADRLAAGEEVTPAVDAGFAGGRARITVDRENRSARYLVNWYGLNGRATAARFQRGAAGSEGEILHEIPVTADSTAAGVWTNLRDTDIEALANGEIYINVLTARNPGGEIRGQMQPVETYAAALEPGNDDPPNADTTQSGTAVVMLQTRPDGEIFLGAEAAIGPVPVGAVHIHRGSSSGADEIIGALAGQGLGSWQLEGHGPISAADLVQFRTARAYADYHTGNPVIDGRGRLVPSTSNLRSIPVSSVDAPQGESAPAKVLRAIVDGELIRFSIDSPPGRSHIVLYDIAGRGVADIPIEGNSAAIATGGLPEGIYFAELVAGNEAIAVTRLVIR